MDNFEYTFDHEANCLFVKHSGLYDFSMMTARTGIIRQDDKYRQSINRLIDLRDARVDLTIDEVKLFASQMHNSIDKLGPHKQAIILTEGLDHGLLKVLLGFLSDMTIELRVFLSTDPDLKKNLLEWLELNNNYPLPDFITF